MPESIQELLLRAGKVNIPAGSVVFRQGDSAETYYVIQRGSIRVFARSAEGREIVLYRIGEGQMCSLTVTCLLSDSCYPADAVAETETTAVAIPRASFRKLMDEREDFRQFVLFSFGERLTGLIARVEQLSLESIEIRLARLLLERADMEGKVDCTHQAIAVEIGSAREVVSRQLKVFADNGWIEAGRGIVRLRNRESLASLIQVNTPEHLR